MRTIHNTFFNLFAKINWQRTLLAMMVSLTFTSADAQSRDRKCNLGLIGGFSTYKGDLGDNMTDFRKAVFEQNLIGGLTFSHYINRSFDITLMGTYGSWGYYFNNNTVFKGSMLHGNINLKYKFSNGYMFAEDSWFAPYIFAGMGVTNFTGDRITNNIDYPMVGGVGLPVRLNDVMSINYQATFGFMSSAHNNASQVPQVIPTGNDMFLLHTLGISFNLGAGKDGDKDGVSDSRDKCPATPENAKVDAKGCPFDTDGDGVLDYMDKCANLSGSSATAGCPDTDIDGVADIDDQCPEIAGLVEFKGCPDTDGDGIIDSKDKCPNAKGVLALDGCPDRDGDGIRDEEDLCPDIKGVTLFQGCPDSDDDGVEDTRDMCPLLKGTIQTNGCPDSDNDRVHDGIDKCPSQAGSPAHSGCPDTDNDGVFDDLDKCVSMPGIAANQGCPEIKKEVKQLFQKALQGVQFETGKAVIKPVSFPILNAIVQVMKNNPGYKLTIGGHTDDVGEDAMNLTLSQERAAAVADYLITKGVDPMRVNASGFGETMPVDTNTSAKGRARNRRVEFNVEFLDTAK